MLGRRYKKSYLIINIILLIVTIILMLNILLFKNTNFYFGFVILLITFLTIVIPFGYEKKRRRFMLESMFYTFSYTTIFLIATYIIGILTGFNKSVYFLNMNNIMHNILPYLLVIIISEVLRYEISRKGETSILAHVLITVIFIIIDCTFYLTTFDLSTGDGEIYYICMIFLPSVFKNILLMYLTTIGGMYPSIIYRILMDLKAFILPIFPDFGMYIESILDVLFPVLLGLLIHLSLKQYKNKEVEQSKIRHSKMYIYFIYIILIIFVGGFVLLASCKFRYSMISIGSGSMTDVINKGDVVVYEKIYDEKVLKKGDIIVFKRDNRTIVHRIIERIKIGKDIIYYTKGDYNKDPDGYPLTKKDIQGRVKFRIKYLGIPSVALDEMLH